MKFFAENYRKAIGIYLIYNKITKYSYIGKSLDLGQRLITHHNELLRYEHVNFGMQYDCIVTGINAFKPAIIKIFGRNLDKIKNRAEIGLQLQIFELQTILKFIQEKKPLYNQIRGYKNGNNYNSTLQDYIKFGRRANRIIFTWTESGFLTKGEAGLFDEIPKRGYTPDDLPFIFNMINLGEKLEGSY